ncbi:dehydrogenase/reductase SDR family member 12 [Felis catus]|uniref:dehydrogenase/reductase SDR family member 12 n=1 Tax=Felis catus TaxID=9685 RepID=UPI001D19AAED|nr:dehydrogenase/reductase SDR family member 12 [Felis catus]
MPPGGRGPAPRGGALPRRGPDPLTSGGPRAPESPGRLRLRTLPSRVFLLTDKTQLVDCDLSLLLELSERRFRGGCPPCTQCGTVHPVCRDRDQEGGAKGEIIRESGNQNIFLHIVALSNSKKIWEFIENFKQEKKLNILTTVSLGGMLVQTLNPNDLSEKGRHLMELWSVHKTKRTLLFPSVLTIETPCSRRPVGKRAAACSRPWGPGEVTLEENTSRSQDTLRGQTHSSKTADPGGGSLSVRAASASARPSRRWKETRVQHAEGRGAVQGISLPGDGLGWVPMSQGPEGTGPNTLAGSGGQHFPPRPRGDPSGPNKKVWKPSSLAECCFEGEREQFPITVLCVTSGTGIKRRPAIHSLFT